MELTLHELCLAVLVASGAVVLLFATGSRWLHARAEARSLRARVVCRLCLHAFEHDVHAASAPVVDCPRCGALNEKA